MASASSMVLPLAAGLRRHHYCSYLPLLPLTTSRRCSYRRSCTRRASVWAMVQDSAQQGPASDMEMERLSAKESLLLAFKDAGGFECLVTGKTTEVQQVDVAKRITSLERLNPTPNPTTSPLLQGNWSLDWFAAKPSRLFATSLIFERISSIFIRLLKVDILIKDGYTEVTADIKFLNSIETEFLLTSKLSVEGPLKMKEESIKGLLHPPTASKQVLPEQLTGALQLPDPIHDAFSSGVTFPMNGTIKRLFMISYLDDEILIIRDSDGLAEVLTKLDAPIPGTEVTSR